MSGADAGADSLDVRVQQRQSDRWRFLLRLYEASAADVGAFQDGSDLADELGIPAAEAGRIIRYFEDRGFVRQAGGGGLVVRITADGIDHVEARSGGG